MAETPLQENHNHKKFRLLLITLSITVLLSLAKFYAYFITGSNAILTDAVESLINIVAGSFALYSVWFAAQPRDMNHPYGHGKIEFLSSGLEGILISIAGVGILGKAIYNLVEPQELAQLTLGTWIVAGAGAVNLLLGQLLIINGRRWKSITLTADGEHLRSDAWSSAALVVGLLIIEFTGLVWLDSILALVLGIILLAIGYRLIRRSVSGVLDAADKKLLEQVISILNENRQPSWIDIHNLRIIKYGSDLHIDCHVTFPWYWTLQMTHEQVDKIENLINSNMESAVEFFIHADPCVPASCNICTKDDCDVRVHPFKKKVVWNMESILQNSKHRF